MDNVFRALADPTRRRVLRMLANGERTAGDLAREFEISAPSMSHHFAVLKAADLIEGRREGQQIVYSLNTSVAEEALAFVFELFGQATDKAPTGELS